jgi:hypothetical protein
MLSKNFIENPFLTSKNMLVKPKEKWQKTVALERNELKFCMGTSNVPTNKQFVQEGDCFKSHTKPVYRP